MACALRRYEVTDSELLHTLAKMAFDSILDRIG
jgi:hypothetical protein